jgi:hypothetical protein
VAENASKEAVLELLGYLEQVERRNGAVLQILKDKGVITEKELEAYIKRASDAVEIESRAIHARLDFLFPGDTSSSASTQDRTAAPAQKPGTMGQTDTKRKDAA